MKRIICFAICIFLLVSMVGCGSMAAEPAASIPTTEPTLGVPTAADMAGTWSQSLWFFSTKLVLNSNGTYDYGNNVSKGLFTISDPDQKLVLAEKGGDDYIYHKNYQISDGYLYSTGAVFNGDTEYGLAFTPDENGRSDQTFTHNLDPDTRYDPAQQSNYIELDLNLDGTFTLSTYNYHYASTMSCYVLDSVKNYKGSYSYKDSILTLTHEGVDHPLVVIDGAIYYITYTK